MIIVLDLDPKLVKRIDQRLDKTLRKPREPRGRAASAADWDAYDKQVARYWARRSRGGFIRNALRVVLLEAKTVDDAI